MIRAGLGVAAVALAMITLSAQDRSIYRAGTDAVALDVSVMRGNTPVTDLKASDFDVRDNGVRQKVQALDVDALPIDVTIAVDTSGSMFSALEGVTRDARVVASLLRPTDRIRLITLADTVSRIMDFQPVGTELTLPTLEPGGATSLYDGVAAAIMPGPGGDRRHLAVIFTDGMDTISALSSDAVVEFAKRTNTVAWVFLMSPLPGNGPTPTATPFPTTPPPLGRSLVTLNTRRFWTPQTLTLEVGSTMDDVAAMTGGRVEALYLDAAGVVPRALARAIAGFRASYVLRYTLQGAAASGWHQVSVTIAKPGRFDVRARRGYFGGVAPRPRRGERVFERRSRSAWGWGPTREYNVDTHEDRVHGSQRDPQAPHIRDSVRGRRRRNRQDREALHAHGARSRLPSGEGADQRRQDALS